MSDKVKFMKTKAHQRYKLASGTPVPGVTTVLGILNKPALLHWAWQQGVDGKDYRKTRDNAADIGTLAHWMIELHLRGLEPDLSEFSPADVSKAENAMIKFLSWWDAGEFEFVSSETQLVHESYKYGGTLDILARHSGELVLVDLKTSKGIYPENWRQVAAYGKLYDDQPGAEKLAKYIICRIGKGESDGDFEAQERIDVSGPLQVFLAALKLYQATKQEEGK